MICNVCPHRRVSDGGALEDGRIISVPDYPDSPHPCHSAFARSCEGHLRDMANGTCVPDSSGIEIKFYVRICYTDGRKYRVTPNGWIEEM